jgi:hypothetical protein
MAPHKSGLAGYRVADHAAVSGDEAIFYDEKRFENGPLDSVR